jgi:hypothetical protein
MEVQYTRKVSPKMQLENIPDWASRAMQGLAYWLGCQDAFGIADRLNEGAIATEFLRLMVVHREPGRVLEVEVLYRDIPEFANSNVLVGSRDRADLVVAKRRRASRTAAFGRRSVEAVIEVKHGRSQKAKVYEDIDALGEAKRLASGDVRTFLLYASVAVKPFFVGEDGSAKGSLTKRTSKDTRYKVRRVCRAAPGLPRDGRVGRAHYVALVEVLG